MNKNNIIIGILIVVVLALLVGLVVSMPNSAKDTNLVIISNSTLNEGDQIEVKLSDSNGTQIANETVNITFLDENASNTSYSAVTDSDGIAKLKLDKNAGNYTVNCTYDGNDNYNGNTVSQKLTIKEVENTAVSQETGGKSSSSSNTLTYDADLNLYYDSNGIVVDPDGQHPMGAGETYQEMVRQAEWEESVGGRH